MTVVADLGDRQNKKLRDKTKGDADYKTHEGNGKQVDTKLFAVEIVHIFIKVYIQTYKHVHLPHCCSHNII